MNEYPLLFTIRELISGNGFLAGVIGRGRCLMVNEGPDEGRWLYGVQPGGIAESGETPQEAYLRFVVALRNALADMAALSPDFDTFHESAISFFCEIDREDQGRWDAAVAKVRSGAAVEPSLSSLPRERAETPCEVQVLAVSPQVDVTPQWNSSESFAVPVSSAAPRRTATA